MKAHASSEFHLRVEAELIATSGQTIIHELQRF